jgi:hypothetical protein
MSVFPPAVNGTTMRIGLLGQLCADTVWVASTPNVATASAARPLVILLIAVS